MPRPIHFEIHASDPARLIPFYESMFGWTFTAWGPPGMYWIVRTGDEGTPGIDGGLMPRQGATPEDGQAVNSFVCTVDVESVSDALARAKELGATEAVPVMAVPSVGWMCYVKDPDGNLLGMMQLDSSAA